MLKQRERGFTLIELLMVVAIIGILAAIAIPNLLNAINRSRQKRSMADMRSIGTAWEARMTDYGQYNAAATGLSGITAPASVATLAMYLAPTYIKSMPLHDGWGNNYNPFTDNAWGSGVQARNYALISAGSDGVLSATETPGAFHNYDCDIVFSNGTFVTYPEGTQTGH